MKVVKRAIASVTAIALAIGIIATSNGKTVAAADVEPTGLLITTADAQGYPYDTPDSNNFIWYHGNYDPSKLPSGKLNSAFTTANITVDGKRDAAYDTAKSSSIAHKKTVGTSGLTSKTSATLTTVWDGAALYLLVEVTDPEVVSDPTLTTGAKNPIIPATADSVNIGIDLYGDKTWNETDTAGVFNISNNGSGGAFSYFSSANIPSLGSIFDPSHPEYMGGRIGGYKLAKTDKGYNVEVKLQIEEIYGNRAIENGATISVEVQISDVANVTTPEHTDTLPGTDEPVVVPAVTAPARIANLFWSHNQDAVYTEFDNERPKSIDWGTVTLAGHKKEAYKVSRWRINEIKRFTDSVAFAKGVYTAATQKAFDSALKAALAATTYAQVKKTADALVVAFNALRWADTKYPDPADLPAQYTLPNPYQFFQSDRVVKTAEDWAERRAEILDLAQFYEYGYKPGAPDKQEIIDIQYADTVTEIDWSKVDWSDPNWFLNIPYITVDCDPFYNVTVAITVGKTTSNLTFAFYPPTADQLKAAGRKNGTLPVVLSFDGDNATYRDAGYAVVAVPQASGGDGRTTEYAWGTRTGTFYELYPYVRDGKDALSEVSSEMAAAWSATRVIDALEGFKASKDKTVSTLGKLIDPSKLVVTGFSINGKYAFVSGLYDDRIDVVIPGAAGATGPSPWRYIYIGHEYDWTGTAYYDDQRANPVQISSGTEFIANSVRHNRVRETELFRHFLNPGYFYEHEDGAYGFATRLPFDQSDLAATLAGRGLMILNTVDDYNDGSEADALGAEVAKSVYTALGYDADDLVTFNYRGLRGIDGTDPHGSEAAQFVRAADYLNHYFFGTELSEASADILTQNPFTLPISDDQTQSPFDYYYGGLNTITGGKDGVKGTDGWYYYTFASQGSTANLATTADLVQEIPPAPTVVDGKTQPLQYTVQKGETLWGIAYNYYGSMGAKTLKAIKTANADYFKKHSSVKAGIVLTLPAAGLKAPVTQSGLSKAAGVYLVKAGDTLGKIAAKYYGKSTEWTKLLEANKDFVKVINGSPMIYEKQWIVIPE